MEQVSGAQARMLPDGRRLHLHHGPIDLIIEAWGGDLEGVYRQMSLRFGTVLEELTSELTALRQPAGAKPFEGSIANRMAAAVRPHSGVYVTPMAAVAGAVADEMLQIMRGQVAKGYVNNGGDIAVYLSPGERLRMVSPAGTFDLISETAARGVATSGWRGRSLSLGIADAVTVLAGSAAGADVAATLIANDVALPEDPRVQRKPASSLSDDSDLGERLVTVHVAELPNASIEKALLRGLETAERFQRLGLIHGAALVLQGQTVTTTNREALTDA